MRTLVLLFSLSFFPFIAGTQTISKKLEAAVAGFVADAQMKNGIMSLYVIDGKTGAVVYNKNGAIGLAAASSQKVITAATAYEMLGKDFRFKTELGYNGAITNGTLNGNFHIKGHGDPTLGSWRYATTKANIVLQQWLAKLKQNNISSINGNIYLDGSAFSLQPLPGGWIWDDIGNYYGAGHYGLNWNENQYDLYLRAGEREGDETQILRTEPQLQDCILINQLTTGKKGSGDNAYIYLPPYSKTGFIKGTIPAGEKQFKISGSFPDPSLQMHYALVNAFKQSGISVNQQFNSSTLSITNKVAVPTSSTILYTHYSPPLDSIVYWFLKKSVNLYGEALLRTLAFEKDGFGSTERGVSQIYNFWKTKGIDSNAMRMMDGSGLSPQNRITAEALVKVMQYAKARSWFAAFNDALPVYNGLKMKSGTIGGAKSFTGYAKSASGTEYTFAIIVNNFNGPASQIIAKMYSILNVLK